MDVRSDNLWSSIPVRLGMLFTLFYVFCFTIGAVVFYASMQNRLIKQADLVLSQRYANLLDAHEKRGIDGVVKAARITRSNNPMLFGIGYQIVGADGTVLSHNISNFERRAGFYDVNGEELGFEAGQKFRFYTNQIDDYAITLGLNLRLIDDLRQNSIASFAVTVLVTTALALIGTMLLASRSHARVRTLKNLMEEVGAGNLDARLPISYRGDDIDSLSNHMNNAISLLQKQIGGMKQVSTDIAHDLKTPMNRLLINIEEAIERTDENDPTFDKLEAASVQATQINETFETLQLIAQVEAGARQSTFSRIDLKPLATSLGEVFEAVAEENAQSIAVNITEDALLVRGDRELLSRMVVSLIENSIRHCPPDTSITISAGIENNRVWISVCDSGPGIPAEHREHVFDRLYRVESSRTTRGAGLGLSLARAVAVAHKGTLTLSANHPGLCAVATFPVDTA